MLARHLEDGAVGNRLYLMGLTGDMSDDIAGTQTLLMKLANLRIHPSMDKVTCGHVPRLVLANMIVHAGFCALAKV